MVQLLKVSMGLLKYFIFFIFLFYGCYSFSQNKNDTNAFQYNKKWFISSAYGVQISGIKSEDFISSNVTPSFLLSVGTWFTPEIALQIAYKGFYFHTISDNDKHYYNFIYGDVLLNLNRIFNFANSIEGRWSIIIHPGAGYFYNNYYNRPNVCGNIGITNSVRITEKIDLFIDVSAIIGWDIYQGDEDILPSCIFGVSYSFKSVRL
ncbi:MAG: hypothetical protein K8R31_04070 [Bacteroidales bacterium]|nr:hypothetical protein [Bacteroidales bacterium]